MLNFCTLFDSNYLARGIALYQSLEKVCASFHLYVFAFDNHCYTYLKEHPFSHLTVVSLTEFEDEALSAVKGSRSLSEYCWTCTPFTILYCLKKYHLDACTYLDSDMIFYNDPGILLDEIGEKSVLITEHRYYPLYDQSWYSGIYCVQFMCFRNNAPGLEVLNWWKDRCLEWCYARLEDGKFGDQKYLDDWPTRFDSVHVLQHQGAGVAPWNVKRYHFAAHEMGIEITEKTSGKIYPLMFFHFHGINFYKNGKVLLAGPLYEIPLYVKHLLYFPYINRLVTIATVIGREYPYVDPNGASGISPFSLELLTLFVRSHLNAFSRYFPGAFHLKNYNFKNHHHLYTIKDLP